VPEIIRIIKSVAIGSSTWN